MAKTTEDARALNRKVIREIHMLFPGGHSLKPIVFQTCICVPKGSFVVGATFPPTARQTTYGQPAREDGRYPCAGTVNRVRRTVTRTTIAHHD